MDLQALIDSMLESAHGDAPGVEYVIALPDEQTLLLPRDSERLYRGGGYYSCHVYADHEVVGHPAVEAWGHLVVVSPLLDGSAAAAVAQTYYGDLRTGAVSTVSPFIEQ